jgi:hypothetical protein
MALIISFIISALIFSVIISLVPYKKAYYLSLLILLGALVFSRFSNKVINKVYGIESNENIFPEKQYDLNDYYNHYENDRKTRPIKQVVGFTSMWLVIGVFILSFLNVFAFRKKFEISTGISSVISIITFLLLVLMITIMRLSSARII